MTLAPDIRDARRDAGAGPQASRGADGRPPARSTTGRWSSGRPSAIRAALETDDLTVWQRIVVAIKRDPYGRTARQVEEVLETARPYGVSKALSEVLIPHPRAPRGQRTRRGGPPSAGTAGAIGSGPGRVRVPHRGCRAGFRGVPERGDESACVADDSDAPAVRPVRQDAQPAPLGMTYALIPGAGGSAWYWHRVAPLLPDAIAIESARRTTIRRTRAPTPTRLSTRCPVCRTALILVAQSMGAFTAPIVASRVPVASIVLVNPMVPVAGESPGQWWAATGHDQVVPDFDPVEDFFHDVPGAVREEAFRTGEPRQSDTPFEQPWPLDRWPDVPTRVIQGSDDRLFPLEFQRRVVRSRLGLELEVMPGGHLMALSQPEELASRILVGPSAECRWTLSGSCARRRTVAIVGASANPAAGQPRGVELLAIRQLTMSCIWSTRPSARSTGTPCVPSLADLPGRCPISSTCSDATSICRRCSRTPSRWVRRCCGYSSACGTNRWPVTAKLRDCRW